MTTPSGGPTITPNPADSILMSLARAAIMGVSGFNLTWPSLDFTDPAQREFGDYELLEEIGRGGMGVVYRARQRSLDRDVAIKFIAADVADSVNLARFFGEARAAARLVHPNIVPVHEVGSVEGVHYFSMPLIKGRSLGTLLDEESMSVDAVIALMLKLCEAIDYAHRLGLLHLDLKPANVLIDARNEPLIADFGLARHMDAGGGVDAQEVSGTPSYMAPEQIMIKQYRLTPATDIYGLGAILYRCLTGASPHGEGTPDELIRRAVAGRIRSAREVNPKLTADLAAVCMKCLELQPNDRYASAAQLADDLRHVRDGLQVSVRRIGMFERAQRWFKREPRLAAALAIAVLALLLGAAATTWQWRETLLQRDAAKSERDRAAIASEIGAYLYAYGGSERARDLIAWLRKRLPGDEERQADALTAFATSVGGEGRQHAEDLLFKIIEVLGVDYRRQVIAALQAGSDKYRHVYSAMLAWNDTKGSSTSEQFDSSMQAAITERPDDPFVWQVAAVFCPEINKQTRCLFPQAAETLVRIAPDNMYHWLLLLMTSTDESRRREALHEAAKRTQFDDYLGANYVAYANAINAAAVPAPSLIARPAAVLAPNERAESSIALLEAYDMPLAKWGPLVRYCGVSGNKTPDPETHADCLIVGERMARSNRALISQMIGVALVKTLAKGTPLADEITHVGRLYTYLSSMDEKLSPAQRMSYSTARYLEDISVAGEMAALQRRVEFFGIPGQPPVDWKPDDPNALLSSRERLDNLIAINDRASSLIIQGKYAEAAEVLAPEEAAIRKTFKGPNAWRLPRFLTNLATARIGQGQYTAAETSLLEVWDIVQSYGPATKDARDCAHAIVSLYTDWNAAEPGKGYDAKASEWKRTSDELQAAGHE